MVISLGAVDAAMLAILVLSMIIGALRGLVFEVLSILGWFVAYFAAEAFAPLLAPHISIGAAGSGLNQGAAFAGAFVAVLLVWAVASRLLRMLVRATPLSLADRFLGAGFGVLRGVVVLIVFSTLIGFTPLAATAPWRQSRGIVWLSAALRELRPLLPPDILQFLPA